MCTATLRYHGPGLKAIMGWVQVITRAFDGDISVDVLPYFADTPLYAYGHLPTFFDAPANPDHPDGIWRADTFLVVAPDVIRHPAPPPHRRLHLGLPPRVRPPDPLDPTPLAPTSWSGHRAALEAAYPTWTFG